MKHLAQGNEPTTVRGEFAGLEVVHHPRQQAGGTLGGVEGSNLAEKGGGVAKVQEKPTPEGL